MNILYITFTMPNKTSGGGAVYSEEIIRNLSQKHNFTVIANPDKSNTREFNSNNNFHPIYLKTNNPLLFSIQALFVSLSLLIKGNRYDVLHGNDVLHVLPSLLFTFLKTKIVTTTHNSYKQRIHFYGDSISYRIIAFFENTVHYLSNNIIAVSPLTANFISKHTSKTTIIPNGIDVKFFHPEKYVSESISKLLFIGRATERKGFPVLVEAMKLLGSDYKLHVITGTEINSNQPNINIHIGLSREQIMNLTRSCDVFILPSISEGMPLTALEAAASGLILLLTKEATGYTDIVQEKVNGLFIERNAQNIHDMIVKLEDLDIVSMKNNSRSISENYTWVKCTNEINNIYQKLNSK